jgi:hypothetical protein
MTAARAATDEANDQLTRALVNAAARGRWRNTPVDTERGQI